MTFKLFEIEDLSKILSSEHLWNILENILLPEADMKDMFEFLFYLNLHFSPWQRNTKQAVAKAVPSSVGLILMKWCSKDKSR